MSQYLSWFDAQYGTNFAQDLSQAPDIYSLTDLTNKYYDKEDEIWYCQGFDWYLQLDQATLERYIQRILYNLHPKVEYVDENTYWDWIYQ
jgi:hypothetical protein